MQSLLISPGIPVFVLAIVFLLIAVRQIGGFRIRIWQIMLGGAIAVLLLGQISPREAVDSINFDVMLFLFGMFTIGVALEKSGYLGGISSFLFARARNGQHYLFIVIFSMGLLSALLMNDTLAIIGTPLVLSSCRRFGVPQKTALLALCFAVTIGSVMSPIGNPQNLLIAEYSQMPEPFLVFLIYLGIPTLINLAIAFLFLRAFCPPGTLEEDSSGVFVLEKNESLSLLCRGSLAVVLCLVGARVILGPVFPLTLIALAGAAPILLLSKERFDVLKRVDWLTLVFFASMFVLMQSVYQSGFFQSALDLSLVTSVPVIMAASIMVSQFISNVPFVALFQPLILGRELPISGVMALAAGSTIAGNLTILGAASNVIVIQGAEQKGQTLTFLEFFRIGLPLTVANGIVYILFLSLF
ncbi:MAG: anion transporter [Methanolinea sp.]|nr:anion transporter [Methanolinea sp.]